MDPSGVEGADLEEKNRINHADHRSAKGMYKSAPNDLILPVCLWLFLVLSY